MKSLWCPGYRHCDIYCLRPRPHVSGHFWIQSLERGKFWRTLNPDAFSSGDVTISSAVLYREFCIQDGNLVVRFSQGRARCKFCALVFTTHALLPIFLAEFWVLEWSRIRVDGQIRFDHGYVWTWKLLNPERKRLWIQKYPDACGRGRKLVEERRRLSRSFPPKWRWFTHGHCLVLRNSRTRYVLGLLITSPGMWQPSEL